MPLNMLNRALLKVDAAGRFDPFKQLPIPLPHPSPAKLTLVEKSGSVTLQLGVVPIWTIDVKAFSGNATLTVTHRGQGALIELKSAFFPATQLPADFICTVHQPGNFGTPLDVAFTLGNFQGHVIAERWLAGIEAMKSEMVLDTPACDLGPTRHLHLKGLAHASFFPDWRFEVTGQDLAIIDGLAPALASDSFALKLLKPGDPSLSSHPKSRRTHLGLAGADKDWLLKPDLPELPIGHLNVADGLFDRIDIEAGEGPTGDVARILGASSSRSDGLTLLLAGGITDMQGKPAALKMSHALYAVAFEDNDVSLSAGFTGLVSQLSLEGFVLLAGGTGTFQVDATNGQITSVRCEPALLVAAAPLTAHPDENVITSPLPVAAGSILPIVAAPGSAPGWGISTGPAVAGQPQLSLSDFSFSVIRREDLLSLDFVMFNLALEAGGGESPRLARKDPNATASLVVRFSSPQNIAEQAFLETDNDGKGNSLTGEPLSQPNVLSVAAGPSRLAFHLPADIDTLPFTLDSLLDWVRLEPSIVPVAVTPSALRPIHPHPIHVVPRIREPLPTETAIEAPWRLFLSPDQLSAWAHSATAVTLGSRTELWHTRLAVRDGQDAEARANETKPRKIRATWSPDYTPGAPRGHEEPTDTPRISYVTRCQ